MSEAFPSAAVDSPAGIATPSAADPRVSIVVLTFNRVDELDRTLRHLTALPERPQLIVVDNASSDGTVAHVRAAFPQVELVRCAVNRGAAARNDGVARVRTPYVAFCDDDTWWEPGALARAADVLDAHPTLALISGRVLVGPEDRLDPACERMADSPLDSTGLLGPALIAYMAGAAVMRADAFREVGGYEPRFFLGAEEALVAMDLLARGWQMIYRDDVTTHHHPSPARQQTRRQVMHTRNRLWVAWLRLSPGNAWRESLVVLRDAARGGMLGPVVRGALAGLPWALRRRKVLPPHVQEMRERVFAPRPAPVAASAPLPATAAVAAAAAAMATVTTMTDWVAQEAPTTPTTQAADDPPVGGSGRHDRRPNAA